MSILNGQGIPNVSVMILWCGYCAKEIDILRVSQNIG